MSLAERAARLEGASVSSWGEGSRVHGADTTRWWHLDTGNDDDTMHHLLGGEEGIWDELRSDYGLRRSSGVSVLRVIRANTAQDRAAGRSESARSVIFVCDGESLVTLGQLPRQLPEHIERIEHVWVDKRASMKTAGDLALLVLDELMHEFTEMRRKLARELANIDRRFLSQLGSGGALDSLRGGASDLQQAVGTLLELRERVSTVYERLEPVNQPGMERSLSRVWFPDVTAMEEADAVDDVLDRSLRGLTSLRSQIGESIDMCATVAAAEQARQLDRLQLFLGLAAALVLWPSLVFAFFGANTDLPGRNEGRGLAIMLIVAAVGVGLSLLILMLARRRDGGRAGRARLVPDE